MSLINVPTINADHEVKRCTRCGSERPLSEFVVQNKKTGGRGSICRSCRSAYGKKHYRENKPRYLARAKKNRKSFRGRNRSKMLEYINAKKCVDCGETDPVVLEFDHRDGTQKEAEVARLIVQRQWAKVAAEIAKCDVRCANCHRKKTAAQFGWTKLALQVEALRRAV